MLSPRLLNRLRPLRLNLAGPSRAQEGSHRSRSRGRSLEFSEHREYVPGDDLRHLDWNVYARLERHVVKVFQAELEQPLYVLFDASASMGPDKLSTALKLAGALAFIGLGAGDRVGLLGLPSTSAGLPTVRGLNQWYRLTHYLQTHTPQGEARLSASLRNFGLSHSRPGQVIVISDFLEPDGGLEGLNFLTYQKHRVSVLQILSLEDLNPDFKGDVRLIDRELLINREMTLDARILKHYQLCLQEHNFALKDWCRRHSSFYWQLGCAPETEADDFLANLLARDLTRAGLIR